MLGIPVIPADPVAWRAKCGSGRANCGSGKADHRSGGSGRFKCISVNPADPVAPWAVLRNSPEGHSRYTSSRSYRPVPPRSSRPRTQFSLCSNIQNQRQSEHPTAKAAHHLSPHGSIPSASCTWKAAEKCRLQPTRPTATSRCTTPSTWLWAKFASGCRSHL